MKCLRHCKQCLAHSKRVGCHLFCYVSLKLVLLYLCKGQRKNICLFLSCTIVCWYLKWGEFEMDQNWRHQTDHTLCLIYSQFLLGPFECRILLSLRNCTPLWSWSTYLALTSCAGISLNAALGACLCISLFSSSFLFTYFGPRHRERMISVSQWWCLILISVWFKGLCLNQFWPLRCQRWYSGKTFPSWQETGLEQKGIFFPSLLFFIFGCCHVRVQCVELW